MINQFPYIAKSLLIKSGIKSCTIDSSLNNNKRGLSPHWQHVGTGRDVLINYYSLSAKYKSMLVENLCGGIAIEEWIKSERKLSKLQVFAGLKDKISGLFAAPVDKLSKEYAFYTLDCEITFSGDAAELYCRLARLLDLGAKPLNYLQKYFKCEDKNSIYGAFVEVLRENKNPVLKFKEGGRLARKIYSFLDKLKVWKSFKNRVQQLKSLIHKAKGKSKNSAFNEAHKAFCMELWLGCPNVPNLRIDKFDKTHIYTLYQAWCEMKEINPVSYGTVSAYLTNTNREIASLSRYGNKRYHENEIFLHSRMRPSPYGVITMDDIVLNVPTEFTLKKVDGKNQIKEVKSTRQYRFWVNYDWHSEKIISYRWTKLGTGINLRHIKDSFKDVLLLNNGLMPHSIMLDNQFKKKMQKTWEKAGLHVLDKGAYKPWQNMAERYHKELNGKIRKESPDWRDMTNHSAEYLHNPDKLVYVSSESEALAIWDKVVTSYNTEILSENSVLANLNPRYKGKSRSQILKMMLPKEGDRIEQAVFKKMRKPQILQCFGDYSDVTPRNKVVSFKKDKRKYDYVLSAHVEKKLKHKEKVRIYFNNDDRDKGYIFRLTMSEEGIKESFFGEANLVKKYNPATLEMTSDDHAAFAEQNRIKAEFEAQRDLERAEHQEEVDKYDIEGDILAVTQTQKKALQQEIEASDISQYYKTIQRNEAIPVQQDYSQADIDRIDKKRREKSRKVERNKSA